MSVKTLLEAVIHKPQKEANASIVWLHGLGADGHDFEDVIPMLKMPESLSIRYIFPHAPPRPITLNRGLVMRAWHDTEGLKRKDITDIDGVRESQSLIEAWLEHEINIVGHDRVILIGFSQGGAMALHTALRYKQPLAGVASLSGYIAFPEKLEKELNPSTKPLPIFLGHGHYDDMVPIRFARETKDMLSALGFSPRLYEYPMEHGTCHKEIMQLSAWIQQCLEDSQAEK